MSSLKLDVRLAELVHLDVLDLRLDGSLALNEAFRAECLAAYEHDPSCLSTVFQERILQRAVSYGFAGCIDVDELALLALEIAVEDEQRSEAR